VDVLRAHRIVKPAFPQLLALSATLITQSTETYAFHARAPAHSAVLLTFVAPASAATISLATPAKYA
jgi:hypothetical protein